MFTVIYSFKVKPNLEEKFILSWEGLTKLIYEFEGSLGSRLHKVGELDYIAYAQWPSKETWKNAGSNLPESAGFFRSEMKNSCEKIETSHEMEVVSDLLKTAVFG